MKHRVSEWKAREKLRFDKTDQGRENTVCMYVYLYLKKKKIHIDDIQASIKKA